MNNRKYYKLEELIEMIDEPNKITCYKILEHNKLLFQKSLGATNNHHAWPGGYIDHVTEVMNIAVILYLNLNDIRKLPFSLSDLLLVLYLHDIEKPWKYDLHNDGELYFKSNMKTTMDHQKFRIQKLKDYGVVFNFEIENAIKYTEGELDDYTHRRRVMSPLAALAHMCDVCSARIWFNNPLETNDEWFGSQRNTN